MFRFKRITSRVNGFASSPRKDNLDSPGKRYETETSSVPMKRLRAATPVKRVLLVPTPSPSKLLTDSRSGTPDKVSIDVEKQLQVALREAPKDVALIEDLKKELVDLNKLIETRHDAIQAVLAELTEMEAGQFATDDLIQIVSIGQNEIRNLLNQIYNPGNELAKRAASIIEETKKAHEKKFQKLSFDSSHLIEKTHSMIKRRIEELEHEAELNERTLMTVEQQRESEEKSLADNKEKEKEKEEEEVPEPQKAGESATTASNKVADEECVIIDDTRASTPSPLKDVAANTELTDTSKEDKPSGTYEDDDDATDIEDSKDDERPFTPCQAQRQTV